VSWPTIFRSDVGLEGKYLMDFSYGVLVGCSLAFLLSGIFQWVCARKTWDDHSISYTIERKTLNGGGIVCASGLILITLLVAALLNFDAYRILEGRGLLILMGWIASTLLLGPIMICFGVRRESTTYRSASAPGLDKP
jgi:hypothetical protein